jgi:hypothetical protein
MMKKYMKIEQKSLNLLQKVKNHFKYVKLLLYLLIEIQQVTIYTKDRKNTNYTKIRIQKSQKISLKVHSSQITVKHKYPKFKQLELIQRSQKIPTFSLFI